MICYWDSGGVGQVIEGAIVIGEMGVGFVTGVGFESPSP